MWPDGKIATRNTKNTKKKQQSLRAFASWRLDFTPDELAQRFPTLSLEQIYATLLYYVRNKAQLDQYWADWLEHGQRM